MDTGSTADNGLNIHKE